MAIMMDEQFCPKCDSEIRLQSDGSVLTQDIAHQGERVSEAVAKLDELMRDGYAGRTAKLRLIVGSGLIREEINIVLGGYLFRKEIIAFAQEGRNQGAIIVTLRGRA